MPVVVARHIDVFQFSGKLWICATVELTAGLDVLELGNSGQNVRSGDIGLDYIEVKPYQVRYEAEIAKISDANITVCDPNNFWATYASNNAYVAQINNQDSYVEFTVNAPVAGTYHLNIHYTNGTGANSQQGLSINGGPFTFVTYQPTEGWGPVWNQYRRCSVAERN